MTWSYVKRKKKTLLKKKERMTSKGKKIHSIYLLLPIMLWALFDFKMLAIYFLCPKWGKNFVQNVENFGFFFFLHLFFFHCICTIFLSNKCRDDILLIHKSDTRNWRANRKRGRKTGGAVVPSGESAKISDVQIVVCVTVMHFVSRRLRNAVVTLETKTKTESKWFFSCLRVWKALIIVMIMKIRSDGSVEAGGCQSVKQVETAVKMSVRDFFLFSDKEGLLSFTAYNTLITLFCWFITNRIVVCFFWSI